MRCDENFAIGAYVSCVLPYNAAKRSHALKISAVGGFLASAT
jgi:hypothetical protein